MSSPSYLWSDSWLRKARPTGFTSWLENPAAAVFGCGVRVTGSSVRVISRSVHLLGLDVRVIGLAGQVIGLGGRAFNLQVRGIASRVLIVPLDVLGLLGCPLR
jgi:hypothetical protein